MERHKDIAQNGYHPRVLVVDDDDELADVLRQALRESGYAVATVRHGAAALELIGQIQPDLILLDLKMPIMDGWSFVSQYGRSGKAAAASCCSPAIPTCARSLRAWVLMTTSGSRSS